MKKKFLLLIMLLFPLVIYAEPKDIFLGKDINESYVVKQGDVVTVYLLTNFGINESDGIMESYNAQFFYNPYIFELVKTDNDYIKLQEGWEVTNYKTYSSIINLSVRNSTNQNSNEKFENDENRNIIAKMSFRVKDNAVNQNTYIELLKDNTNYITKTDDETLTFNNTENFFLNYEINSNETKKQDSNLTSISIESEYGNEELSPSFNPGIYNYEIKTNSNFINVNARCVTTNCSVTGNIGKINLTKDITTIKIISTSQDGTKQVYKIKVNKYKYSEYPELKNLKILKYNMIETFEPYVNTYHIIIPSTEDSLLIDYESEFDVTIKGNENLKIGENLVVIETKNSEGDVNEYYIIVSKTEQEEDKEVPVVEETKKEEQKIEKKDNKKLYLAICMIISMCAIGCITILISRDIKLNKEKINKE